MEIDPLQIDQATTPQGGYGFGTGYRPLPPAGRALLDCSECQGPRNLPGRPADAPRIWRAQLRMNGLFIAIRSTNRRLVIEAARTLFPMPG